MANTIKITFAGLLAGFFLSFFFTGMGGCRPPEYLTTDDHREMSPLEHLTQMTPPSDYPLVTPEWLSQYWNHPALLLLDTRRYREYEQSHLPNAQWFDVDRAWKRLCQGRHAPENLPQVRALLGGEGIDNTKIIVVYGDGKDGLFFDAIAVWFLRYQGLEQVYLLDGGTRGLGRIGMRFTSDMICRLPPSRWQATINEPMRAFPPFDQPRNAIGATFPIEIDVRDDWETVANPLPDTVQIPWPSLLQSDGSFLPIASISQRLRPLAERGNRLIVRGGWDGRACLAWIAFRAAGWQDVRICFENKTGR